MAKKGPAPIEIPKDQFEKICALHPTLFELAAFFGVSEDTIQRWSERTYGKPVGDVMKEKAAGGRVSLRRAQWLAALEDRNPTMLIWLGKQHLNQADKQEQKITVVSEQEEIDQLAREVTRLAELTVKANTPRH